MTHPNLTLLRTTPKAPSTLRWTGTALDLLDQTRLPQEITYRRCEDGEAVREAIVTLQVRGAPAIGLAAAWGLALAMTGHDHLEPGAWRRALETAAARLRSARPTAVNLSWALAQQLNAIDAARQSGASGRALLTETAARLQAEDEHVCATLGAYGAS